MNLTRYDPNKLTDSQYRDMEDFVQFSPKHGGVVAIYGIDLKESDYGTVYFTEYEDGMLWTIVEREDYLGTLSGILNFLTTHL